MVMRSSKLILLFLGGVALIASAVAIFLLAIRPTAKMFDGQRAYQDVLTQMDFGPRTVGSEAHDKALAWMQNELKKAGWTVEIQSTERMGHPIQNLIAYRGKEPAQIIIGAHYDSRLVADQDQGPGSNAPVPGANDGASGVAVLLELARTLPRDTVPVELVFIDAEDNGNIAGWDWLLGSQAFVESLTTKPRAAIIVDMIGDADLNIYKERNSDPALVEAIWAEAAALGYEKYFIPSYKYSMLDDHTPFLEAGIPAVDIIDFDYPYWHTSEDTADKVSAQSLEIVGKTLWAWVVAQK
jgi:glutaminyl-peptide cyclotransferase